MKLSSCIIAIGIICLAGLAHANQCHRLEFLLQMQEHSICEVTCSKGKPSSIGSRDFYVDQDNTQGPSCKVSLCRVIDNGPYAPSTLIHVSKIHIQQNVCILKAGNIHVSLIDGKQPVYTAKEGNFSHSRSGEISVTGFQ